MIERPFIRASDARNVAIVFARFRRGQASRRVRPCRSPSISTISTILGKLVEQIFCEECRRNFSSTRLSKQVNPYSPSGASGFIVEFGFSHSVTSL